MVEVTTVPKQSLSQYYPEGKRLYPRLDCGMQEGVNVPKVAVDVGVEPPVVYEFSVTENKYVLSTTLVLRDNGDIGPQNAAPTPPSADGNGGTPPSGGGETRQNTTTQGGKVVNLGQDNFYC